MAYKYGRSLIKIHFYLDDSINEFLFTDEHSLNEFLVNWAIDHWNELPEDKRIIDIPSLSNDENIEIYEKELNQNRIDCYFDAHPVHYYRWEYVSVNPIWEK